MKSQLRHIPTTPSIDNMPLLVWMREIQFLLKDIINDTYDDISCGNSRHKILNSIPTINDIAEGEIVFALDGANWKLYTRINSVIKSTIIS